MEKSAERSGSREWFGLLGEQMRDLDWTGSAGERNMEDGRVAGSAFAGPKRLW